jgi:signal transduction histidine kinase
MHNANSAQPNSPLASWLTSRRAAEACRILLLSTETPWSMSFRTVARQMEWRVKRLDGPVDALAHVHEFDPHVFIVGPYSNHELTLMDLCDALSVPRQLRPLALLVTTDAPLHSGEDMAELGVDEVLESERSPEFYSASLLQHFRLSVAQRTVLDREREILDSLPDALAVVDRELTLWQMNRAFAVLYDVNPPEMLRRHLGHPLSEALQAALNNGDSNCGHALSEALRAALAAESSRFRCCETWKDKPRTLAGSITPLAGSAAHVLITVNDVTDHEQVLRHEARRERLATLGNLAVGVAHEIQNPNTFSRVNASNLRALIDSLRPVLERAAQEQPELRAGSMTLEDVLQRTQAAIDGVALASSRIAAVVDTLKVLGTDRSGEADVVNLRAVITEAAMLTGHARGNHILLTVDLPPDVPQVRGAAAEFIQVFINLIENAVHALEESAPETRAASAPEIRISVEEEDRERIIMAVQDNGPGIPETLQTKIFRPYFTTREQGQGVGLGLSISSEILQRWGGDLTVRSRVGQGATFLITLQCVNL